MKIRFEKIGMPWNTWHFLAREIRALLRDFIQATWMLDISGFCLKRSTGLNLFSYPWSLYPIPSKQSQMYNIENTGKWDRKRGSVALNRLELAVHTQDKNIWFVTRNKRKMWFGDSWVSFPPWLHGWWTSWQIPPKIQVRFVVNKTEQQSEEECATRQVLKDIFPFPAFSCESFFFFPKKESIENMMFVP